MGINDVDNGAFLPASASAKAPELADAVGDDDLHRLAVYLRGWGTPRRGRSKRPS